MWGCGLKEHNNLAPLGGIWELPMYRMQFDLACSKE